MKEIKIATSCSFNIHPDVLEMLSTCDLHFTSSSVVAKQMEDCCTHIPCIMIPGITHYDEDQLEALCSAIMKQPVKIISKWGFCDAAAIWNKTVPEMQDRLLAESATFHE
jgi:hypothetical protein